MDPFEAAHINFINVLHTSYSVGKPPSPLWVRSTLIGDAGNCIRRSYDRMVAKQFILSTRKGGIAMNFLMPDFILLVCVKFSTSEVEESFFRFF